MRTRAKRVIKSIVPPLLWEMGKDLKRRLLTSVDHFAFAPDGWSTRLPAGATSDDYWNRFIARERLICEALIARVQARDPVSVLTGDMKEVLFGYVLALVARHRQTVTVLDYGGNLGDYYWLGKALVPDVELDYHCKELPLVAEAGRQITPAVTWHTGDACLDQTYDLVMFSSSLHCLQNWQDVLRRASRSARCYLLLSDVPTVRRVPAFVVTQRSGGMTHLQYQLNRSEIVATVERAGLRLLREFDMGPHPRVANTPEQSTCVGWLFERDTNFPD
jgi:putative methyltransferase (TIGR04325 family)